MAQTKDIMEKNLMNVRKSIELPTLRVNFLRKLHYFFNPSAKYLKQRTEQHQKALKRGQNQRYYALHSDEIRAKRRDYYGFMGK